MTRFCATCKKVVSAGHGKIIERDGKKVRTACLHHLTTCDFAGKKVRICEPTATRVRKKGPVLERLQKKLKANQNNRNNIDEDNDEMSEMSKMMTTEQAEIENAGLPEGYRYVLVEELQKSDKTLTT